MTHKIVTFLIAAIWLINGLFCKVLNLVPRHQQIVGEILGYDHARLFTSLIGLSEMAMAGWIISRWKSHISAIVQMIVVAIMNTIEFFVVPDLLLWNKMNAFFALILIGIIYYNEFVLDSPTNQ